MFKNIKRFFSISKIQNYRQLNQIKKRALLYTPKNIRKLSDQQALKDRVVRAFFTSQSLQISIYEADNRIKEGPLEQSTPAHSFYKVVLPFDKSKQLAHKFIRFYSQSVRIGRIIEVMDYIAGNVAYRYCEAANGEKGELDYYFVTAAVDKIDLFASIKTQKQCSFSGYVTYVGSSSIEVCIDVEQDNVLNCTATFVMVGKKKSKAESQSKQKKQKFSAPKITFETDDKYMRIRHNLGEERQLVRKQLAAKSLLSSPPSGSQSQLLHTIFVKHLNSPLLTNQKLINSTLLHKTILMHRQDMNLHGKIFGGHIMKQAVELGWLCAYMFVKGIGYPQVYNIDDIQFYSPVDVGDVMSYEARVCYTVENVIHVVVKCKTIRPDGTEKRTNQIKISLLGPKDFNLLVLPQTYEEAILYLDGKRAIEEQTVSIT